MQTELDKQVYEFLALEKDFKSQDEVFSYCNEERLNCYWKSKFLFINKALDSRDKKEVQKKLNRYIVSFDNQDWGNVEEFDIDYLKKNIIEFSIPYTVAIFTKIKLQEPYFSRDDEEYYFINNPILKDKSTKIPMARGSGLKGNLEVCAAEVIFESIGNPENRNNLISELIKYLRIFGSGNEEIRELIESLKKLFDEEEPDNLSDNIKEKIAIQFINFILLNFGGKVAKQTVDNILESKDAENVINEIINWIYENLKDKEGLKVQKGRLIFYPIYFNKVSIEVINRHSRSKRAGEGPIYFEVVPKGEEANFVLVYTPFDAVFSKSKDHIKKEAEEDLDFIIKSLEKLQTEGIGAKRKYGWGQFQFTDKIIIKRNEDILREYKGWEIK